MDEQIIDQINNALNSWYDKLQEVIDIITINPRVYRGGALWDIVTILFEVVKGVGIPLLALCIALGIFGVSATIAETRRPEVALKTFIRAAIAYELVSQAQSLMLKVLNICQDTAEDLGMGTFFKRPTIPDEIVNAVKDMDFWPALGVYLIAFLGSLAVTVASFIVILTVYGRFFKIYLYVIVSPIPLAFLGGKTTEHVGISFIKSFIGVGLEAVLIVAAIQLYSTFVTAAPLVTGDTANAMVWNYMLDTVFNVLILVTIVKTAPTLVREMFGL